MTRFQPAEICPDATKRPRAIEAAPRVADPAETEVHVGEPVGEEHLVDRAAQGDRAGGAPLVDRARASSRRPPPSRASPRSQ
jgi:hypothetical protein